MKSEVLNLGKHFLTIDSTIPFELYNPITQTTINKASGRWVIDCWKLLTKEYFKNNPQFVLELRYDESLLVGKNKIEWHITDIDIGSIQSEYQLVTVANLETSGLAEEATLQTVAKEATLQNVAKETTLQTVAKEATLQNVAKETTLHEILNFNKMTKGYLVSSSSFSYFRKGTIIYGTHSDDTEFIYRADSDVICNRRDMFLLGLGFFVDKTNKIIIKVKLDVLDTDVKTIYYLTEGLRTVE